MKNAKKSFTLHLFRIILCGLISFSPALIGRNPAAQTVDALLPSGRNLFLFDFAQSRYQKWNLPDEFGSNANACALSDTLKGAWNASRNWLALPAPGLPFTPMQAIWGPSGNFFLLDRAGKRLVLYDTSAQYLSSFSLPQEIRDRNLEGFQIFWSRDGMFSFLDLDQGKVWQYAELKSLGGSSDWRLRNTMNLPVGLETCLWEPFFRSPCCMRKAGGGHSADVCFDNYFNPNGPWPQSFETSILRPEPLSAEASWLLRIEAGKKCGSPSRCFYPEKGKIADCPAASPQPAAEPVAPSQSAAPAQAPAQSGRPAPPVQPPANR